MSSYRDRHRKQSPARNDARTSRTSVDESGHRDHEPRTVPPETLNRQGGAIFPRDERQHSREGSRDRNYDLEGARSGTRTVRVVDYSKEFAKLPLNDTTRCGKFIKDYPDILREPDIQTRYLDPAARLLATNDKKSREEAFRYLERFVIIVCIKEYHRTNKGQFLSLVRTDDAAKHYMRNEFTKAKEHCEKRVRSNRLRSSEMPYFTPARDDVIDRVSRLSIDQIQPRQPDTYTSRSDSDHHSEALRVDSWQEQDLEDRHNGSAESQLARRTIITTGRHDPIEPDIPEEGPPGVPQAARSTRAILGATIPDNRFQQLQPHEWDSYFRVGRVFAIKSYTRDNSRPNPKQDDFSVEKLRLNEEDADVVMMYIRRMVVVSTRRGFCLTVPINTYGGKGLKKPGLRETNIYAHARIHMEGVEPSWLPNEPRSGKRDIAVRKVKDSRHVLHPASRICFERTHSVDYNERILKIGIVTDGCLGYLAQYWREEIERESGQSQGPKRPSGQGQGQGQSQSQSQSHKHR